MKTLEYMVETFRRIQTNKEQLALSNPPILPFSKKIIKARFGVISVGIDLETAISTHYAQEQREFKNIGSFTKTEDTKCVNTRQVVVDGERYTITVSREFIVND